MGCKPSPLWALLSSGLPQKLEVQAEKAAEGDPVRLGAQLRLPAPGAQGVTGQGRKGSPPLQGTRPHGRT